MCLDMSESSCHFGHGVDVRPGTDWIYKVFERNAWDVSNEIDDQVRCQLMSMVSKSLCSMEKWPLIVDFPIEHGDFP